MHLTLRALLNLFAFWVPLLLSCRATQDKNSSAHRFLLTYWIFYSLSTNANNLMQMYLEVPLADVVDIATSVFNIWLFYGHGCLVLTHHFLPGLFYRFTGFLSLEEFDHEVLSPVISPVVNAATRKLLSRRKGSGARGSAAPQLNRLSILDFGVDQLCYTDDPTELYLRYMSSRRILSWPLLAPAQRATRRRAGSGTQISPSTSHTRKRADLYQSDVFLAEQFLPEQFQPGPAVLPKQTLVLPKQRRERGRSNEGPEVYGFVSMGDSWSTRALSPRSASDGEVDRRAQMRMKQETRPREIQIRELNNKVFVPASAPAYRA